jgi:UDP-N-acetylmuramoyl-L-alanyl-D-glutamate--2,6-diaminopimelate ligase
MPVTPLTLADVVRLLEDQGILLTVDLAGAVPNQPCQWATDSRSLQPDEWFLAYRGESVDSHRFLTPELLAGVGGVIYENSDYGEALRQQKCPRIQVKSGRLAWAYLAAARYGNPQEQLKFLGVTGTNGKTSTVWLTRELLQLAGTDSLGIGTLGAMFPNEAVATAHTTPDPDRLFAFLDRARQEGVTAVVMEVSSHALVQERLGPIRFVGAAFTSFSRDHLDFHPSMDDYFAAKRRLFELYLQSGARAVLSQSVAARLPHAPDWADVDLWLYGIDSDPQVSWPHQYLSARCEFSSVEETLVTIHDGNRTQESNVPLATRHGIENFLAALLLAEAILGERPKPETWSRLRPIPGRLEPVRAPGRPLALVDYAHTPDALEHTLETLRPLVVGSLWVVFGCGGDRDRGKRPLMGEIAARLADRVIVTSDNPRSEDPQAIANEICAGMTSNLANVRVQVDRHLAIHQALTEAAPDDVVLIAGKGHETYQIIGKRTLAFDDRQQAAAALGLSPE